VWKVDEVAMARMMGKFCDDGWISVILMKIGNEEGEPLKVLLLFLYRA